MHLQAITLGSPLWPVSFEAEVHSVFDHTINIKIIDSKYIQTLIFSDDDDIPGGARFSCDHGLEIRKFKPADKAYFSCNKLSLPELNVTFDFRTAHLYNSHIENNIINIDDPNFSSVLNDIIIRLVKHKDLAKKNSRIGNQFLLKCNNLINSLAHASITYKLDKINHTISQLVGFGPGLTPSGDDIILGYLAGLWSFSFRYSQRQHLFNVVKDAVISHKHKTNDISGSYLLYAAHNNFSSKIKYLLSKIGHGASDQSLSEAVEKVLDIGSSSGFDIITGLLSAFGQVLI